MIRKTIVAALMLALCGSAGAAGLGRINVMSSLGQPLRAEIELTASNDELDNMVVRMASADAYKRAGIEYVGALATLKTSIERRGRRSIVKVTSDRSFNEPFLDILVDLSWNAGHLQREYTVLLNPEDMAGPRPLPSVNRPVSRAPATPITPSRAPAAMPAPATPAARSESLPESSPAPSESAGADEYTVKRGDSLYKIAGELKSGEVTQEQMVAALYKANSDAFIGKDINRLTVGRILKVPDEGTVAAIKPAAAHQIILKAGNFEAYRRTVADSAAMRDRSSGQTGQGKVTSSVVEPTREVAAKDKVTVTATTTTTAAKSAPGKTSAAGGASAASQARIQALMDENESRRKELQDARSRIQELEQNIQQQKKLLDMKSEALARAEDAAKAAGQAKAEQAAAAKAPVPAPAVTATNTDNDDNPSAAADDSAQAMANSSAAEIPSISSSQVPAATQDKPPVAKPKPAPKPVVHHEPPPVEKASIFENYWLMGGGALVLLLALLKIGHILLKARRKQASYGTGNTQLSEASTTSPNSVFGNAGGQTVDTGGTSLLHTDFSQSGMASIDADEGVDPVAEADVYMAYGRDAQAEEILLDALKADPKRTAVYVKLLEIYAQRRSLKQFENTATDLYTQTGGAGDDWAKAAALGAKLDPNNPLYQGAGQHAAGGSRRGNEFAAAPVVTAATGPDTIQPPPLSPQIPEADEPARSNQAWEQPVQQLNEVPVAMPELAPEPEPEPESVPEAALGDSVSLDFNLDLDSPVTMQPLGEEPQSFAMDDESATMEQAMATDPMGIPPVGATEMPLEFDIGLDDVSPAAPAVDPAPVAVPKASTTAGVEVPQNFGSETEFDIGIETNGEHSALSEVDLEKTNFEGSLLDFDFELGDEEEKAPLDLSDVDLGASVTPEAAAPAVPAPEAQAVPQASEMAAAIEPIQEHIDVDEEIATKLELAKAYEEMGDVEGARELLEEVVADGADPQKEQARTMLSRLA